MREAWERRHYRRTALDWTEVPVVLGRLKDPVCPSVRSRVRWRSGCSLPRIRAKPGKKVQRSSGKVTPNQASRARPGQGKAAQGQH